MSLPPYYTPGHYRIEPCFGGYVVLRPSGTPVGGEPTEKAAALAKAAKLNETRAALASRR